MTEVCSLEQENSKAADEAARRQGAAEQQRADEAARRQRAAEQQRADEAARRQKTAEQQRADEAARRQRAAEQQRAGKAVVTTDMVRAEFQKAGDNSTAIVKYICAVLGLQIRSSAASYSMEEIKNIGQHVLQMLDSRNLPVVLTTSAEQLLREKLQQLSQQTAQQQAGSSWQSATKMDALHIQKAIASYPKYDDFVGWVLGTFSLQLPDLETVFGRGVQRANLLLFFFTLGNNNARLAADFNRCNSMLSIAALSALVLALRQMCTNNPPYRGAPDVDFQLKWAEVHMRGNMQAGSSTGKDIDKDEVMRLYYSTWKPGLAVEEFHVAFFRKLCDALGVDIGVQMLPSAQSVQTAAKKLMRFAHTDKNIASRKQKRHITLEASELLSRYLSPLVKVQTLDWIKIESRVFSCANCKRIVIT